MLEERLAAREADQKILTERAEEILLLGSVAQAIDSRSTKETALETLLEQAQSTYNNGYEIYWLNAQIRQVEAKL